MLILRMRSVPALDITALKGLRRLWEECGRAGVQLVFSHVNEQPMSVLKIRTLPAGREGEFLSQH